MWPALQQAYSIIPLLKRNLLHIVLCSRTGGEQRTGRGSVQRGRKQQQNRAEALNCGSLLID